MTLYLLIHEQDTDAAWGADVSVFLNASDAQKAMTVAYQETADRWNFDDQESNEEHMPSGYWPTFEFYVDVLSEGGWRELTGIGSRTQLPVGLPQETLERALQHIHKECLAVLKADSSVSLKEIGERISKITPEMFAQSCARE